MNLLVLGGADTVFDDAEAALNIGEFDGVVTVNDVTAFWPGPILACASLHAEKWPYWLHYRRRNGFLSDPVNVVAHTNFAKSCSRPVPQITHHINHLWTGCSDSGSSGLFGAKAALEVLGATRVVMCGVPMEERSRHFFDSRPWEGAASHRRGWLQAAKVNRLGAIRSMSGWTAELVGRPTADWFEEETHEIA